MSLPLKLNFSDYDKFLTDPNYTTSAEAQDYFRNMDMLVEALIDVGLWQPETNYPNGHVVFSPNMPNGAEAVCVATTGGKSSNTEPSWGEVGGDNISDGTCFWKLRWKHWSKDIATQAETEAGTDNTKVMTPLRTSQEIDSKRPIKTFTSLEQLGLNNNATIEQICEAMPDYSVLMIDGQRTVFPNLNIPLDGQLIVNKNTQGRIGLQFNVSDYNYSSFYFGTYANWSVPAFSGWKQLATNGALSMPSSNSIQLDTSLTSYTAPADGWLHCAVKFSDAKNYHEVVCVIGDYASNLITSINWDWVAHIIPVPKGANVKISHSAGCTPLVYKFIYAQSEV